MNKKGIPDGLLLTLFLVISGSMVNAQKAAPDTAYIRKFKLNNVLEFYPGAYETRFRFSTPGVNTDPRNDFQLTANSSAFAGIYFNYKWLSIKYSTAIPGTRLDKNVRLGLTSVRFRFTARNMMFHPFYDSFDGLLIPKGRNAGYDPFKSIKFTNVGFDYYYFTNAHRFSFRGANAFSEKQVKSAGGVFFMVTPAWQKVDWRSPSHGLIKDTTVYELLSRNPEWVYVVGRVGYAYNISIKKGKWLIAPAFMLGMGGVKKLASPGTGLRLATDVQAWLNAGYNGDKYYLYFSGQADNLRTNLLTKDMSQINNNIQLTGGYRFGSLRKKILGLL